MTDNERLEEARKILKAAKKKHTADVNQAKAGYQNACRDYEHGIDAATAPKNNAENEMTRQVNSIGPSATLFGDHVECGGVSIPLSADITAHLESSGGVYSREVTTGGIRVSPVGAIVGHMVAGDLGMFVGGLRNDKSTHTESIDTRQMRLVINSSKGGASVDIAPDSAMKAFAFAKDVMSYGQSYEERKVSCQKRSEACDPKIKAAIEDKGAMLEAKANLDAVTQDVADVDVADKNLHMLMDSLPADVVEADRRKRRLPYRIARGVLIALMVFFASSVLGFLQMGRNGDAMFPVCLMVMDGLGIRALSTSIKHLQ